MNRWTCLTTILLAALGCQSATRTSPAPIPTPVVTAQIWPHPIPCRVQDGNNPDLFMMTLGDVDTPLAQGTFDPVKDQVTLKGGRVMPDYYKKTLGLPYYKPVDKTHYALPPSGWCTWYYYYYHITADEVKRNARWISENLKDYGAQYVQIDDGWQRSPEQKTTRDWTWVHKGYFPKGMADVAAYIKSVGLIPGIWLAPHGQDDPNVIKQNPKVFLLKPDGTSASSTWEGKWLVDPTTKETEAYMKALFKQLCDWGYEYFKIDGQPIVVEEYAGKKAFMRNPSDDPNGLYRKTLDWMREVIGPDRYLLGCWGIPTEGAGIMDGSRTGGDIVLGWGGFQVALSAVMAYYYQHNVMWYVDPDVMVLRSPLTVDQARVWATLQGLTGQALMATDRMMDLGEEREEMLRRVYPAVDIRPLDLFPSGQNKRIWDLKVNHLGREYDVVGVFNFDEKETQTLHLKWSDLGLPTDRPLHVFDFWNKDYLGAWQAGMTLDVDPTSCRVLTILPSNGRIQLISTSRHITQGWVDLKDLKYDETAQACTGTSRVIKDDPYELRFVFPRDKNFKVKAVTARGGRGGSLPVTTSNHQGWACVRIESSATTEVSWKVTFEPEVIYAYPAGNPERLRVERVGLDGVDVTWAEQYYLNCGYQVYLDGELQGYTPKAAFPLRGLDPKAEHKVGVETVWEDGTVSEKKVETTFTIQSMIPKQMSLAQLKAVPSSESRQGPWQGTPAGPVSIGDKSYQDVTFVRPGSETAYEVKGLYKTFSAGIGLGDPSNDEAAVEFVVLADGKELFKSGSLKKADGLKPVSVDISGVQRLVLKVTGTADRRTRIQAAWVDGTLSQ